MKIHDLSLIDISYKNKLISSRTEKQHQKQSLNFLLYYISNHRINYPALRRVNNEPGNPDVIYFIRP